MKKLSVTITLILFTLQFFSCSGKSDAYETPENEQVVEADLIALESGLQDSANDSNQPYISVAEEQPVFPGGLEGLKRFLLKNVKYPLAAQRDNLEGVVFITFIIRETGTIDNIEVVRSVRDDLDEAAVAAVRKMPHWQPGKIYGEPISMRYYLPIRFELDKSIVSELDVSEFDFQLYPNPAREVVTISVLDSYLNYEYQIYDLTGKRILNGVLTHLETEIRLDKFGMNTYVVKVYSPDHLHSKAKRLIINK